MFPNWRPCAKVRIKYYYCVEIDYGIHLSKKECSSLRGGGSLIHRFTSFYRQSISTSNFSFIWSVLSLFSPINCFLSHVHSHVCLRAYFYATKICIRCRPSLYIFRSHTFYIFSIFADIEFKVSLLISLLYTPNKVLPSFCWNLHLTLVHCHIVHFHTK